MDNSDLGRVGDAEQATQQSPSPAVSALSGEYPSRELLEPDAEDVRLILHAELPRCPCCMGTPTTFARYFPHSKIYQSYVHCSRCDLQVFKNSRDREEARRLAIKAWSHRPAERQAFTAGWRTNAIPEDAANVEYLAGCEAVDYDEYSRLGLPAYLHSLRDSDGSGEADETGTGSAVGDSAGRETASPTPSSEPRLSTLGDGE